MKWFSRWFTFPTKRTFISEPSLVRRLRKHYDDRGYPVRTLVIFATNRQRTWLVATGESLYCVIDRPNEANPKVIWRTTRDQITDRGQIRLTLYAYEHPDIAGAGIIIISHHAARKFTTGFFVRKTIVDTIGDMLVAVYG